MTVTPYQIVVPLLSLLAVSYVWSLTMKRKKTVWEAILWTIFWAAITVLAVEPSIVGYLSIITGIKSQGNAVAVTSIGILFFLVFYIIIRLEELEQRQTRIVRSMALREAGLEEDEPTKGKK